MKKIVLCLVALPFFISCKNNTTEKSFVDKQFEFIQGQLELAQVETEKSIHNESEESKARREKRNQGPLVSPRSINEDGSLMLVPSRDWCSGFFPGSLWYTYEYTKDEKWKDAAMKFTTPIEQEKDNAGTHDMGFKVFCSFGNGYRLTGNNNYRDIILESAQTLIKRYSPKVKAIRSWDHNKDKWQYPVIIDNMMNLELLFWAFNQTKDSTYYNIAVNHAETTLKNHFRSDYSSYHVVDYDTITGEVLNRNTHQGYSHESAWARGQAWAIYGYTMCYRETGKQEFLEQAKHVTNYVFTNPNLPSDLIPYWDFDAPEIPNEPRDVSAATVIASALFELSLYDTENANQYRGWSDKILTNLSANYLAKKEGDYGFILLHSTGSKPGNFEVDAPLSYADYYYLEALLRKDKLDKTGKLF